jgi:hypothetical protein
MIYIRNFRIWAIHFYTPVKIRAYYGIPLFVRPSTPRTVSLVPPFTDRSRRDLVFSVSFDDNLILFLFPGIPTGDPAIVAFYDKRIYKKLRLKELPLSDPLYHGKKQHRNMTK